MLGPDRLEWMVIDLTLMMKLQPWLTVLSEPGDIPTPPVEARESWPASQPAEIVFLSAGLPPVLLVSYLKIERRIEGNM